MQLFRAWMQNTAQLANNKLIKRLLVSQLLVQKNNKALISYNKQNVIKKYYKSSQNLIQTLITGLINQNKHNLISERIKIFLTRNQEGDIELFDLQFNPNSFLSAEICNFVVDLSYSTSKWDFISFTNCQFICNQFNGQCIDIDKLNIIIDNNTVFPVDLSALVKARVIIDSLTVRRKQIDIKQVNLIIPSKLQLYYCDVNLNDFEGVYNDLVFSNCKFTNINQNQIQAENVSFIQCEVVPQCFTASSVNVFKCSIFDVPRAQSLQLSHSTLNLLQNVQVSHLQINNCIFKQFSLLRFNDLISVQTTNAAHQKLFSQFLGVKKQSNKNQIKTNKRKCHEMKRKDKQMDFNEKLIQSLLKINEIIELIQKERD
ncbi:Hypothetical_protein [Hexamita inflata]|uniref:Hypothetical_protein n=1 Tax=Hexamita inflata TaxID=28002 RepID=A0AA86R6G2_9EUKA|nr:Hypothetical protein HINF_LOCUS54474 [Hexamita inflata]